MVYFTFLSQATLPQSRIKIKNEILPIFPSLDRKTRNKSVICQIRSIGLLSSVKPITQEYVNGESDASAAIMINES